MKGTFDAILLLGLQLDAQDQPAQELRARVSSAAGAYRQGLAPVIIACGGITPGRGVSEAEVMRRLLLEEGVPQEAVLLEDQSQTTPENFRFAARLLGGAKGRRVLVVTSDYHVRRSVMTARREGFAAKGRSVEIPHDDAWCRSRNEEFAYTVDLLMGWQDEGKSRPEWTYRLFEIVFGRRK